MTNQCMGLAVTIPQISHLNSFSVDIARNDWSRKLGVFGASTFAETPTERKRLREELGGDSYGSTARNNLSGILISNFAVRCKLGSRTGSWPIKRMILPRKKSCRSSRQLRTDWI